MHHTNENIGFWIAALNRQFNSYMSKQLTDFDIKTSEYIFIVQLNMTTPLNQEELSSKLYISKSATTKAIKRLVQLGYIYRVKDENDKRAYQITLTEKGNQLKEKVMDMLDEWVMRLTHDMDRSENEETMRILKKMSFNINNPNKDLD